MTDHANQPAVLEAASAGVKDMADGSLRITFEFEPRHATVAFALFGTRGRAVAVAALKDGSGALSQPSGLDKSLTNTGERPEKPKGGEWAKLAGMWCADADFYAWIRPHYDMSFRGDGHGHGDLEIGVDVANVTEFCTHAVKYFSDIGSRRELDHDAEALRRFNETVRFPFMKWMQTKGIVK